MKVLYLSLNTQGVKSRQSMITVEEAELITRAEKDYWRWQLASFFNVGLTPLEARYGIRRDFNTWVKTSEMKERHLLGVIGLLWMKCCQREGALLPLPPELRYFQQRESDEVSLKVTDGNIIQAGEWPSVHAHNMTYPKIKHLVWHVLQHVTGFIRWLNLDGHGLWPNVV